MAKSKDAYTLSKNSFHHKIVILSDKELDESIKHTSEVRHICPKTGDILENAPQLDYEIRLRHIILNYKGKVPFCKGIQKYCKRFGYKRVTRKQKDAFLTAIYRDNRSNHLVGKV